MLRLIDRLYQYIEYQGLTAYSFEQQCELSNGYLGKQYRGKGSIGSSVILKIQDKHPYLNIQWLITGRGRMIRYAIDEPVEESAAMQVAEPAEEYEAIEEDPILQSLRTQIDLLKQIVDDKNSIIELLKKKSAKS